MSISPETDPGYKPEREQLIAGNTNDVPTHSLSDQTVTYAEYMTYGGMPFIPQNECVDPTYRHSGPGKVAVPDLEIDR